jgi:hypothetical protein
MPQRCYKTDKVFSCYTIGRKYSFGNLTAIRYWDYADPVCPSICWKSDLNSRLKSPP